MNGSDSRVMSCHSCFCTMVGHSMKMNIFLHQSMFKLITVTKLVNHEQPVSVHSCTLILNCRRIFSIVTSEYATFITVKLVSRAKVNIFVILPIETPIGKVFLSENSIFLLSNCLFF